MKHNRRQILAASATTGSLIVAGCLSSDDGGNGSDDGSDESDDGEGGGSDAEGGVPYTVEVNNGNVSAFDSLVVTFEAFELRGESETARREGTGEEIDLTAIETKTILETNVPAGEYADAALFLPVSAYQASDGSEGDFLDNDPLVMGVDSVLEEGNPATLQAQISVQGQGDDWGFSVVSLTY